MIKRIALLALSLIFILAPQLVRGGEIAGRPLVVLIGIDRYADPQIKSRKHAEADAKALYDLFLDKQHLGVDAERAKLLLGGDATKENILKALRWIEKSAGKDDLVILGMFGNGAPLGDRACYFAVDSTFKNRAKDAVASAEIEPIIDKVASQRLVTLVDVHFLGFDAGKEKTPVPVVQNFYREFMSQSDETKDQYPSRVAFVASSSSRLSLDLDKHGVFAQALLDGLGGAADASGYEADGAITISELTKHMRKHLPELIRANAKTIEEKKQRGGVFDFQTTDFLVGYNAKARNQAQVRLKKFETFAQEQKLDKDLAAEGQELLARMPKLESRQKLRKAYQKLVDGKLDLAGFKTERKDILESAVLEERDGRKYATTIINALGVVQRNYYKDVVKATLIEGAVLGLYDGIEEKPSSEVKERLSKIKTMSDADLYRLLFETRTQLGNREDLDKGQDITFALNGMLGKLDRHTGYLPPEAVPAFDDSVAGKFRGIGVQVRQNEVRDELQVITPIFNSPAHKAGLRADDIITKIISEVDPKTGKEYEKPIITPTKGLSTNEAVKLIKGKPGTHIKLVIEREGEPKPVTYTLVRNDIEVESVLGYKRNEKDATWNYVVDEQNKICYVRLDGFAENTYADLEKVMKQLTKQGIKGFILDLRFNPGGGLDTSIHIADLFIDDGIIVTVKYKDGKESSYVGRSDGSYTAFPMVCLINSGSASASEIVSAALQDHGRAIIMGSRSYGKGSVQSILRFDHGSKLKVTTSTFWRPNGRNLNKTSTKGRDEDVWGVAPNPGFALNLSNQEQADLAKHLRDTELIRAGPAAAKSEFRDRQLEMALDYLRSQIRNTADRKEVRR